jgi:hypothetical protein
MTKSRRFVVAAILAVFSIAAGVSITHFNVPVIGTLQGLTDMHLAHSELHPSDAAPSGIAGRGRLIVSFLAPGRHQPSQWLRAFWATLSLYDDRLVVQDLTKEDYDDTTSLPAQFGVSGHVPVTFFLEDGTVVYRMTGFSLEWWSDTEILVRDYLQGKSIRSALLETNLEIGLPLGEFKARTREGTLLDLPPHGRASIIYIVSPRCSVCAESAQWARSFSKQIDGVVWYSLILDIAGEDGLASASAALRVEEVMKASPGYSIGRLTTEKGGWAYADSLQLPGHVVLDTQGCAKRILNIGGAPVLLLVDGSGRLLAKHALGILGKGRARQEVFNESLLKEVERISGP